MATNCRLVNDKLRGGSPTLYTSRMKLNPRFVYPELERITNDDGVRHYTCPETGIQLPSVTTILSATSDKTTLLEWRERVGDKEADRLSKYGTDLGSLMHEGIENHIAGKELPRGSAPMRVLARKMATQIIDQCLPHVDEIWGVETALYYPGLYAGTTDLVGIYNGKESVMDHKSSKKMKKQSDILDYRDQLCAYIIAHNEKYGTSIEQGVVFMASRDLKCETFIWNKDEISEGKASFLDRVGRYLDSVN